MEEKPKEDQGFGYIVHKDVGNDTKIRSSLNGFKGFTVSNSGELLIYSDRYGYTQGEPPEWNINTKFKYKIVQTIFQI